MSALDQGKPNSGIFNFLVWRERFLRELLYVVAGIGLLAIVVYILTPGNIIYKFAAGVLYGIFILFTFLRLPHLFRATFFLLILYSIALSILLDTAAVGEGSVFFLGWIALSVLIISPLAGWITTGVGVLSVMMIGWLFLGGFITPWNTQAATGEPRDWILACTYLVILAVIIVRGISLLQHGFIQAQEKADYSFQELQKRQLSLTDKVTDATAELQLRTIELEATNTSNARRARQFEAISQVLSSVASLRSMEELLPRISESISEQYGFYHVGIFLNDPENRYAILSSSNSPGGQKMLAREHRLRIGEQGMVGYVTQTGNPRIALDVGADAVFFNNPDLPDTRSEMTLPLKVGGNVIGALDIQSTEPSAFSEDDTRILSSLANQVSLAIDNARLFEQTTRSLAEAEALSRQYLKEGWNRLASEELVTGYKYSRRGVLRPIELEDLRPDEGSESTELPILLRGEKIGSLVIHATKENRLTEDQIDIAIAVAERVALSAENARLFDEVSRRAERERTVSQITTNIRSTTDPQLMIQTALDELKNVLGVKEIEIRPYLPAEMMDQSPLQNNTSNTENTGIPTDSPTDET
jgi:GAF domain-containing protein